MSSFCFITLDTTAPELEIFAPSYTTNQIENHITIEANEELSSYQEVYLTDSLGNRYDYSFLLEGNKLIGKIKFTDSPLGFVTLFAKVKDTVNNESSVYQKTIEIKENLSSLKIEISDDVCPIFISETTNELILTTTTKELILEIEI
ncbi:hypothetical protein [Bacillus sp. T33-2]|uniref:hypothetical protein n=1 Tax=Bacillus sp. T33-2 TaxID=2054168 RepID=UPI000C75A7AD|nr:hypothetical protein [Bacillus sp. T33-2]PLR99660.1 hypothetical protein CVD19_00955 [Bacillus sp. T33-2]